MLRYTSPLTLKNSGENTVRKVYAEQVVPAFQGATISWNKNGSLIYDEHKNAGITFSGIARKEETNPFYLDVFGENGDLVIMNIRSTPRQY